MMESKTNNDMCSNAPMDKTQSMGILEILSEITNKGVDLLNKTTEINRVMFNELPYENKVTESIECIYDELKSHLEKLHSIDKNVDKIMERIGIC